MSTWVGWWAWCPWLNVWDNMLLQNVSIIWWIMVCIIIIIPPEHYLSFPIIQPSRVRASHILPNTHITSQSDSWNTKIRDIVPFSWQPVCLKLSEGRKLPTLASPALSIIMSPSLNMGGCSGPTFFAKISSHNSTVWLHSKCVLEEDPRTQWPGYWKQGKSEEDHKRGITLRGKGNFVSGKRLLSFTLIPTSCHFRGKWWQTGTLPPISSGVQWM